MVIHDSCVGCTPVMLERDVPRSLQLSRRKAQALIAEGVLHRLRRGVVVGGCLVEQARADGGLRHQLAVRSLLMAYDDAAASHESAALVANLPVLDLPAYPIVTRERGAWRGGTSGRVRIAPLPAHHLAVAAALPHTTPARTFVDVAKGGTFGAAVVLGDAVLRERVTLDGLVVVVDECANWAEVGKARRALSFLDPRSESPLESVSRAIMHERGLPQPVLQTEFDAGVASYRVDFYWDRQRVIGEADGLAKYVTADDVRSEKIRQERLERMGLKVVRWTWREILVDTDETIARIRSALVR